MTLLNTLQLEPSDVALVVDLDGTLLRTDLLFEQVLKIGKSRPWMLLLFPLWLARGVATLKAKIAALTELDAAKLPYRQSLVDLVRQARTQNRAIILASASSDKNVQLVSRHLGLFTSYIASGEHNMKGARKLEAITERLGGKPFIYAGDSAADLGVWSGCSRAIAVNPTAAVERALRQLGKPTDVLRDRRALWVLLVKQMRVVQWVKNALVFVPLIAAHRFYDADRWRASALAALAFSLLASAVYVMNDLLDVEADRAHHAKCRRPFASGELSLKSGLILLPILMLSAGALMIPAGPEVAGLLMLYFVANIFYSFKLKEIVIIDTVVLAAFYTLRILVGGAAAGVALSQWLLAFSVFFFFGLAMVKRFTELLKSSGKANIDGRGYGFNDKLPIFVFGVASSFLSVLILVLYLHSQEVVSLYSHSNRLWMITPLLLYWSSRVWLLAHRGQVDDDPVIFSIKDRVSWGVLLSMALILGLSL